MSLLPIRLAAGALVGAFVAGGTAAADAHAVCGDRIFPATLAIDDPGVTDELTVPTVQWLPQNSDGVGELDVNGTWAKTIFPNLALSAGVGPTWLHGPGGFGWDAIDTELKYQFMCIPGLELMASLGFDVSWGGSATGAQTGSPNMYSPVLDVGLGFGPTTNAASGTWGTTGTVQPGVVYMADKWQVAVEAVIPINAASGHGAGAVASLDLFLDDIFPDSIGKPIFSQSLPMFTGARE